MPGHLPKNADFDSHLTVSVLGPPKNQQPTNILILLHGLGDINAPFTRLALQLNLPETAYICVQAPTPVPDALALGKEGWHWGDDIVLDNSTGGVDMVDVAYNKSIKMLLGEIIVGTLLRKCGYALRDIMIYGFGQGGTVALSVGCEIAKSKDSSSELGGIITIGGPLPSAYKSKSGQTEKSKTPVLVLHGSSQSAITPSAVADIQGKFENVQMHQWKKVGDGMPSNKDEMLPIMQFFAKRLKSLAGIPIGALEIK